jgi:hypothetical protein
VSGALQVESATLVIEPLPDADGFGAWHAGPGRFLSVAVLS